jgi:hypothetical protein
MNQCYCFFILHIMVCTCVEGISITKLRQNNTSWEKQSKTEEILSFVYVFCEIFITSEKYRPKHSCKSHNSCHINYLNVLYAFFRILIQFYLRWTIYVFCKRQGYSWDSRALCQRLWVILWDMSKYSLVEIKNSLRSAVCLRLSGFLLGLIFNLEYVNSISLRNVCKFLWHCTASHQRRWHSLWFVLHVKSEIYWI